MRELGILIILLPLPLDNSGKSLSGKASSLPSLLTAAINKFSSETNLGLSIFAPLGNRYHRFTGFVFGK